MIRKRKLLWLGGGLAALAVVPFLAGQIHDHYRYGHLIDDGRFYDAAWAGQAVACGVSADVARGVVEGSYARGVAKSGTPRDPQWVTGDAIHLEETYEANRRMILDRNKGRVPTAVAQECNAVLQRFEKVQREVTAYRNAETIKAMRTSRTN